MQNKNTHSTSKNKTLRRKKQRPEQVFAKRLLSEVPAWRMPKFLHRDYAKATPFLRSRKLVGVTLRKSGNQWKASALFEHRRSIVRVCSDACSSRNEARQFLSRVVATAKAMSRSLPAENLGAYSTGKTASVRVTDQGTTFEEIRFRKSNIPKYAHRFASTCPDQCGLCLVDKIGLAKKIVTGHDAVPTGYMKQAAAFLRSSSVKVWRISYGPACGSAETSDRTTKLSQELEVPDK